MLDFDSYCFADTSLLRVYPGKCSICKGQSPTADMKARLNRNDKFIYTKGHSRLHHFSFYTCNTARSGKSPNLFVFNSLEFGVPH